MNEDLIFLVGYGAAAAVGSVAWWLREHFRLSRRMRRVPRRTIAQLEDNTRARVTGVVRQHQALVTSGLTGRRCVYYRVEVFPPSVDISSSTAHMIDERIGTVFVLEDAGGRALVDPTHVELELHPDSWSTPDSFARPTPTTDALLARHGFGGRTAHWKAARWFRETLIRPGDTITLVGLCVREIDPAGDAYRAGGGPIAVRMGGSPEQPMWLTRHRRAAE